MELLNEKFTKVEYDKEKYPYYEYYSDHPDENYIEDILEHKNENIYLESKKTRSKKENEIYSINDLIIFNKHWIYLMNNILKKSKEKKQKAKK